MPEIVRVLVVDDSAYVRKVVVADARAQSVHRGRRHGARRRRGAGDGRRSSKPDVVTCDLNMPVMDGVAFVRAQMARRPVAIVIISIAAEAGEQVLAALDAGADRLRPEADGARDREADGHRRGAGREGEGRRARRAAPAAAARAAAVERRAVPRPRRRGPDRHCRDRHLDRRAAGAEGARFRSCRRIARCRSRWCCTCRSATPKCTRRS